MSNKAAFELREKQEDEENSKGPKKNESYLPLMGESIEEPMTS